MNVLIISIFIQIDIKEMIFMGYSCNHKSECDELVSHKYLAEREVLLDGED